ncbi:MAG: response regulator [Planctomycetota bacterium]
MPAKLDGRSVLVVDDDQDVLTTVKMAFEASGAEVTTARDGNMAVELARRLSPDLIVLDMMMPKRSGFLVVETLKPEHDPEKKPYVIMITANEGKRHAEYARYLGVNDYVHKPFSMDQVLETACNLLGGEFVDPERKPEG